MNAAKKTTHPLKDFENRSAEFARQIKESGEPLILTIDGKPELAVCDIASFRKYQEYLEYQESVAAIREGYEDVKAGRGRPAKEVFKDIEKKYGFRN